MGNKNSTIGFEVFFESYNFLVFLGKRSVAFNKPHLPGMVVIVDHSREAGPAGAAAVTAKEECMMGTTCRMGGRAGIPRGPSRAALRSGFV